MGVDYGDEGVVGQRRRSTTTSTTALAAEMKSSLSSSLGDSGNREKARELWCNVKHQLVEYSQLPEYLRDNAFIIRHYRADWNFKHAFYSMFSMHNETFNVWS